MAPEDIHLGIDSFNGMEYKTIVPITPLTGDRRARVDAKTNMIMRLFSWAKPQSPNYNTPLYDSIAKALPKVDNYMNSDKFGGVLGDICIITDGKDTSPSDTHEEKIEALIAESRRRFIPVHILGIGFGADETFVFRDLVKNVGGAFTGLRGEPQFRDGTYLGAAIPRSNVGLLALTREFAAQVPPGGKGGRKADVSGFSAGSRSMFASYTYSNLAMRHFMRAAALYDEAPFASAWTRGADFYETSLYIDPSLINFSLLVRFEGLVDEVDVTLTSPNGSSYALDTLYSESFLGLGTARLAEVDLDDASLFGKWTLRCVNKAERAVPFSVRAEGQCLFASSEKPAIEHAVVQESRHNVLNLAEGEEHKIRFVTSYGGALVTSLDIEAYAEDVYGSMHALFPRDDGLDGDDAANDGVYTARFPSELTRVQYVIRSRVSNPQGRAVPTYLLSQIDAAEPEGGGEEELPAFGEPIADNFERSGTLFLERVYDRRLVTESTPLPDEPIFRTAGVGGLTRLIPGTDKAFSIDITPDDALSYLSEYVVWETDDPNTDILPDTEGRKHVVRVRPKEHDRARQNLLRPAPRHGQPLSLPAGKADEPYDRLRHRGPAVRGGVVLCRAADHRVCGAAV